MTTTLPRRRSLTALFPDGTPVHAPEIPAGTEVVQFDSTGPGWMQLISDGELATLWFVNVNDPDEAGTIIADFTVNDPRLAAKVRAELAG